MNTFPPDWKLLLRVVRRTRHRRLIEQIRSNPAYWKVAYAWDGQPMPAPPPKPRVALGTPHCVPCHEQRKQG